MKSYAPGKHPVETVRNVFIAEPGLTGEQRIVAYKLYRSLGMRFIAAFVFGGLPYAAVTLIDVFFNDARLFFMTWPLFALLGLGIAAGLFSANVYLKGLESELGGRRYSSLKLTLTKKQLGPFLTFEEEWEHDSASHREVWDWAQNQGKKRVAIPDSLFSPGVKS